MRCVILAGGFAKRLWPLTLDRPKALLDIGGRTILDLIVDNVECIADVDEIVVSTNSAFEPAFRTWIAARRFAKPVRLLVEPTRSESEKFGAIRGLAWLIDTLKISDDCLVVAGDNMFDFRLSDLVAFYRKNGSTTIALYDVGSLEKARLYGTVKLEGDRIAEFYEKSQTPMSTLASTACYVFPKTALKTFDEYLASGNPKDAPGHFLAWLCKRQPVYGWVWRGTWFDIGDFLSLEAAKRWAAKPR